MSVTSWNFLADGEEGPKVGADGTRDYKITIEATTDAIMSGIGVLAHSAFPRQYISTHPDDPFALCITADPQRNEDNPLYWRVAYGYSTKVPELAQTSMGSGGGGGGKSDPNHDPEDPLSWAPKVRWSTKMFKRIRFKDEDGQNYTNGAGEYFEGAVKELPRLVLSVKRNVPTFDVSTLNQVNGGVNNEACIGYAKRRIKCEKLTAEPKFEKKQFFWELDGEFIIGSNTDVSAVIWPGIPADGWWYEKKLNAGYTYYDLVAEALVPILQRGQRPARPVPLAADGSDYLDIKAGDVPNFIYFRELSDANFNITGIFAP